MKENKNTAAVEMYQSIQCVCVCDGLLIAPTDPRPTTTAGLPADATPTNDLQQRSKVRTYS